MKIRHFLPIALLLIAAQDLPPVEITAPETGEVLRGQVTVTGRIDVPDFVLAQLDFGYAPNPTGTWFNLRTFAAPLTDSTLAVWDTTLITDGEYALRLRVTLPDGAAEEVIVPVKVANDAPQPVPTEIPPSTTPESAIQVPTPFLLAASPTPTDVPPPTPTRLPPNPASLRQDQILASLGRGGLVILGLFGLAGLLLRVRRY